MINAVIVIKLEYNNKKNTRVVVQKYKKKVCGPPLYLYKYHKNSDDHNITKKMDDKKNICPEIVNDQPNI